ncbi:unnamed protein product [Phaedon cochleariae]|uniref:Aprataxin and PNK-like factor PBZ domain-containing protein n=1 Tax=Phaedon cochleariae TaxID=80249 RepID=A0A9P0GQC9_PHACE|nr:unnamed protein product [Phaedon cochleariae]
MDSLAKRKHLNSPDNDDNKRPKIEHCPHNERCYRRNPHHFKQYEHPYLSEFIESTNSPVIPDSWPQPKNIYLEQIEILRSLSSSKPKIQNIDNNKETSSNIAASKVLQNVSSGNSKPGSSKTISINQSNIPSTSTTTTYASDSAHGTMMEKLERAAPYNIFFTTIIKAPLTTKQPNAITFTDLLCPSLGVLKNSLQINFMIDIDWLLKQYKARGLSSRPLTILFGDDWPDMAKFIDMFCPNVKYKLVKMKDPFGVHHSKVGIYIYEDNSIRVVVSTANLYYEDWNHYNQGLWLSPSCPQLPDSRPDSDGESPTGCLTTLKNIRNLCLNHS